MSDITELFSRVAPPADAAPSNEVVEADLARGRVAMAREHRRRTIRRSVIATSSVAAAAVVIVVASQLSGGAGGGASQPHHQAAHSNQPIVKQKQKQHHPTVATSHHKAAAIKLVSYDGTQLAGFTVDRVPDGWFLSTSTQYALLIDPDGDKDNDPDAFVGKLAVLTQSKDVTTLPPGTPVTVNGQPGVVSDQGKYGENLTYNDAKGFGVVIQAPAALNWSDQQIVSFAEGVHVTSNALKGSG
jgi:hypothetical protein